ncbi:unnamed protein product [Eruca vesicaria subsp. sativa]|uniref:non-specific serine/threonine protein kinase n=1 Tax=Eruca vesicaria subsp. sativa TaxID=29727 RepID=A0ABC8KCU8_ERUVS|nr:unnamed protein product [Eruca vesicaria subsp. sativa]
MAIARSIGTLMFLLFLSTNVIADSSTSTTEFTFLGFRANQTDIQTESAATIQQTDGLLRLTNRNHNVTGTAFYRKPIRLRDRSDNKLCSFSTSFIFVIIPSSPGNGGFGFTFTLSPTPNRPGAESAQYLGLLNRSNNGHSTNHVFAVEFDTVQGFKDGDDRRGNHIGLDFNNLSSAVQEPVIYYDTDDRKEDFQLESGEPIQAHLDYDGATDTLNVTVYPTRLGFKPNKPLMLHRDLNLSEIVKDAMFVGFTSATGKGQSSSHYVMGWSFASSCGEGNPVSNWLNVSLLPRPPPPNVSGKKGYDAQVVALIASLSIVTLFLLALLFVFLMYKRQVEEGEALEDWEIDYPHRFSYKDLYLGTKKFKESEIIGSGGFGIVYRGKLPSSGDVAVKKINQNSLQGVREFVAEIESLGRLSHKNLVNLQGWCKHNKDLLLVYDYIPNGSLDSLLYTRNGIVLTWEVRFEIIKGVASGLLYLHEEWEQVVIHRDVKASNVLVDADLNAKLGDFGLARLYDRGTLTQTTKVVGTLGYMAPELTRNGKGSTASDVFAFGVLLLEIVCGRRPTNTENFFLADWVMDFHTNGGVLRAVDQKLGSSFNGREAKLALVVGLLCCHHKPTVRPTMRNVIRYLNGDEDVPEIDGNLGFSDSSRDDILRSNVVCNVSTDRASSSSTTFSFSTEVSSGSLGNGR